MWLMCIDRKKSIVSWTNELLKWLHAPGIHYPQQLPAQAPVCGANTIGGHQPPPTLELGFHQGLSTCTPRNARGFYGTTAANGSLDENLKGFNPFLSGWHEMFLKQNEQHGEGFFCSNSAALDPLVTIFNLSVLSAYKLSWIKFRLKDIHI